MADVIDMVHHEDPYDNKKSAPYMPKCLSAYVYACFTTGSRWMITAAGNVAETCYHVGTTLKEVNKKVYADTVKVPQNYKEAMQTKYADKWKEATKKENNSIRENEVFETVSRSEVPK